MRRDLILGLAAMVMAESVAVVPGRAGDRDVPEKAACVTCEARGAGHGAEKVKAWREYEGELFTFCSDHCAEAFDAFPAAYVKRPVPRPAPAATLTTLEGEALELESLEGKVVLLDFWATWCKPCVQAMPELGKLHERWAAEDDFTVLGVSIDQNAEKVVPKFVKKKKVGYPVLLDTGSRPAWFAYHVAVIPAMFLIDRDRRIVAEWRGKVDPDEVQEQVRRLLETPAPPPGG